MFRSFLEVLFPFLVKTFFAEFNVFATCIQLLNYWWCFSPETHIFEKSQILFQERENEVN